MDLFCIDKYRFIPDIFLEYNEIEIIKNLVAAYICHHSVSFQFSLCSHNWIPWQFLILEYKIGYNKHHFRDRIWHPFAALIWKKFLFVLIFSIYAKAILLGIVKFVATHKCFILSHKISKLNIIFRQKC